MHILLIYMFTLFYNFDQVLTENSKRCPKSIIGAEQCTCYKREAICTWDSSKTNNTFGPNPPFMGTLMDDVTYSGYNIKSTVDGVRFNYHSNVVVKRARRVSLNHEFAKKFIHSSVLRRLTFKDCKLITIADMSFSGVFLASLEFNGIGVLELKMKAFDGLGISRLLRITNTSVNELLMPRQLRYETYKYY